MMAEGKAGYDNPDKNDMPVLHAREHKPKKKQHPHALSSSSTTLSSGIFVIFAPR